MLRDAGKPVCKTCSPLPVFVPILTLHTCIASYLALRARIISKTQG